MRMTVRKQDLFEAIKSGTPELVKALVMTGADIDAKDSGSGITALKLAVFLCRSDMIATLVSLGANINEDIGGLNLLEWFMLDSCNKGFSSLSDSRYATALELIRSGLRITSSNVNEIVAKRCPDLQRQAEELQMNFMNFRAADTDRSVRTDFEYDI